VKLGGKIAIVPDEQVEAVRKMLEGGYVPDAHDYFDVGDEVEIGGGPMVGLQGILVRKDGETRFVVRVDGIQQAISVHIDAEMLKPVKYP
jgi:transcription antitermination factor NusG